MFRFAATLRDDRCENVVGPGGRVIVAVNEFMAENDSADFDLEPLDADMLAEITTRTARYVNTWPARIKQCKTYDDHVQLGLEIAASITDAYFAMGDVAVHLDRAMKSKAYGVDPYGKRKGLISVRYFAQQIRWKYERLAVHKAVARAVPLEMRQRYRQLEFSQWDGIRRAGWRRQRLGYIARRATELRLTRTDLVRDWRVKKADAK